MEKKQILIILLFITVVFSVLSAVSAADDGNFTLSETENQNSVEITDNDILNDSLGTLNQLNDKIQKSNPGDTVVLDKNYVYTEGDIDTGIVIDKDLTIEGSGKTIDGASHASIFKITGNSHVILKNILFLEARGVNGSAVNLDSSTFEIIDCDFINNQASQYGGALYSSDNIIATQSTIVNSSFINNKAEYGGAAYLGNSNINLLDTLFTFNSAERDGGAVYWTGLNGTSVNSKFINNTALLGNGGAINLIANTTDIFQCISVFNSTTFNHNTAIFDGGAIYSKGAFTMIRQSQFSFDTAKNGGSIYLNDGAAIHHCTFYKESATDNGGAFYMCPSPIDLTSLDYNANQFLAEGGLKSSTVINCSAGIDGGAGYVSGDFVIVDNVTYINNTAGHDGGAGYITSNFATLTNSQFIDNVAARDGGALMWTGIYGNILNINCTGNHAEGGSGSVCLSGDNMHISNSIFTESEATLSGGAIYIYGNDAIITDSTFDKCQAIAQHGGSIFVSGLNANIENCNFTMNMVNPGVGLGGSIYIQGNKTKIRNCFFDRASASKGGFVFVEGNGAIIDSSYGLRSFAADGGAFYVMGNNAVISNSSFELNNASRFAGGIYVEGNNALIFNISLEKCIVYAGDGGAIYLSGLNTTVSDSTFSQNSVLGNSHGGSIYIEGNKTKILKSTFDMCTAYDGAVMYIKGNDVLIDKGISSHTLAYNNGGTIYVEGNNVVINDFDISYSNATANGGGIYVSGNNVNMSGDDINTSIAENGDGGAVYIGGHNVLVEDSIFTMITAPNGHGGAVYILGDSAIVRNSNLSHAYAFDGGLIYIDGIDAKILGNNFTYSWALDGGGAIYVSGDNALISGYFAYTNVSAPNQEFSGYGGSIYVEGQNTNITHSTFYKTIAENGGYGGAIFIVGNDANVEYCNISYATSPDYFDNDGSASAAGAIAIGGSNAVIRESNFNNGFARNGGALFIEGFNTQIINCNITDMFADLDGGAIYIGGSGTNISGTLFENCHAERIGGAIFILFGQNTTVEYSNFTNCTSEQGGAFYIEGDYVTITKSDFDNCIADEDGGAIYILGDYVDIDNSNFTLCNADNGNGGAIYWKGSNGFVDNCNFTKDTAKVLGGSVYLEENINVVFKNSQFVNNTAGVNGGAIDFHRGAANGAIINSTFENNIANRSGGAVFWFGTNGTIVNSNFTNNTALGIINYTDSYGNVTYGGYGGAVIWTGEQGIVDNCRFEDNEAKYNEATNSGGRGGAVYLQGSDVGNCTNTAFKNSVFINNTAGWNGGAVDWYHGAENGRVENSTFINNTAKRSGGGIYWSGVNGTIKDSTFSNNFALGNITDANGGGDGGAVLWVGHDGKIINATFENNTATYRGGGIFLKGSDDGTNGHCNNVSISNSRFENNYAGTNGGAVDFQQGAENGLIDNSTFINNSAARSAGAVYWHGTTGTILNSNFTDNRALGNYSSKVDPRGGGVASYTTNGGNGGAIVWTGSHALVDNCIFENNSAAVRGGAVYLQKNTNSTFSNSRFVNNTAGTNGGALDWFNGANDGRVINSTFENNTAKRSAGAIYWCGNNGLILNSNFTNNRALGSVYAINVYGVNTIGGDGGAISWIGSNGTVKDSKFYNNSAKYRGGALYLQKANATEYCRNITVYNSTFVENLAGTNGGAIDWFQGAVDGRIDLSVFANNTAKRSGGAVYWSGENGNITNSNFTNNRALGIVHADDRGPSVVNYTTQGGNGGAIIWTGDNGYVDNCRFINNTAPMRGGAVYLQRNENATFKDSLFANNTAGTNGGAIDWYEGAKNGIVDNVTFINNTAKRSGGAIYWYGYNGTVKNSKFNNNRATGEYLQYNMTLTYDKIKVVNKTEEEFLKTAPSEANLDQLYVLNYTNGSNHVFKSYVAHKDDEGNLIWLKLDETEVNVDTISPVDWGLDQFFGGDGGTILWSGDLGNVYNCSFIDSNSARRGGGAYMTGSDHVTYNDCYFENCTSGTNGGGVDWLAGANYGVISNSVFNNTRAARSAGAIYYDGWYGKLENVTIIGTKAWGGSLDRSKDGRVIYAGWDSSHWDTNTTGGDAGAIMFTGNHEYIYNVTFINCTATGRGGAVFLQDSSNVTFDLCNFTGNEALGISNNTYYDDSDSSSGLYQLVNGRGGAIAFDIEASNGTIKNSYFADNVAARAGGAISFAEGALYGNVTNSTFINNTAKRNGGAIFWNGKNGTIVDSNFTNNRATGEVTEYDMILTYEKINVINNKNESEFLKTIPTSADADKLFVLNYTEENAHIFKSYVAHIDDDGNLVWLKLDGIKVNVDTISPVDWAIDQFFGGDGGTVLWSGDGGLVDNCRFIESNSARRGGGAYMTGSDYVTYNDCYFENCTSGTNGGGVDWLAGANYGLISNSVFNNTRAARSAGAIYYDGWYGKLENVTIIGTIAWGGSLDRSKDGRVIYAGWDSSHWDTNTTGGDAGAIMFTGNHEYIYNVTFINCTATGRGGAVFLQDSSNVTFDLCNFTGNEALGISNNTYYNNSDVSAAIDQSVNGLGGAIAFDIDASNGTIKNSYFADNIAARNGGAIDWCRGAENGLVDNSTFINNTAKRSGGAIHWSGTNGQIKDSRFINNTAFGNVTDENGGGDGGAVLWVGQDGLITGSEFINNTATYRGGGIFLKGSDDGISGHCNNVSIKDSIFENNYAGTNGGAVDFQEGAENGLIDNSTFTNNSAARSGGAVYWFGTNGTVKNSNFTNNRALGNYSSTVDPRGAGIASYATVGGNGGAIVWTGTGALIADSNFVNNSASKLGGSIYVRDNENTSIENSHFTNNYAGINGGAVDFSRGAKNGIISNSTFENNTAMRSGGAIFWFGTNGIIRDSNFTNNSALGKVNYTNSMGDISTGGSGGAIIWTGSQGLVENSIFTDNEAAHHGGAVYVQGSNEGDSYNTTFDNCKFIKNTAGVNGGAVDWHEGAHDGNLLDSVFENNVAKSNGGAVFWNGHNGEIRNSNFTNNTAQGLLKDDHGNIGDGGAVIWSGLNGTVDNCKFIDNEAAKRGGAVFLQNCSHGNCENTSFTNVHFENNIAGFNGGAIDWYKGAHDGLVENATFINNTAKRSGGAIYWSGTDGTIRNSQFINNTALGEITDSNGGGDGGAVLWVGNEGLVENSEFTNNNAVHSGGAIFLKGSDDGVSSFCDDVKINACDFTNNTAGLYGGAVDFRGATNSELSNSNFANNTATRGSAVYIAQNTLEISNSKFIDNKADSVELNVSSTTENGKIEVIAEFKGNDNLLNAIWNNGDDEIGFTNVTYCGVNGIANTGSERRTPVKLADNVKPEDYNNIYQTQYEDCQDMTFYIYDSKNNVIAEESLKTNISGVAKFTYNGVNDKVYAYVFHPDDTYYTGAENSDSKKLVYIEIPVNDMSCLENQTVVIEVISKTDGTPTGNVTVTLNNKTLGNFSLNDGKIQAIVLSNLPVGKYDVTVRYTGDDDFLPKENKTTFKVIKEESFINVNAENYTYGESGKITIQVPANENATVKIKLNNKTYDVKVNESGYAEFEIPELSYGKYPVEVTYPENEHYAKSANKTEFEIYPVFNLNIKKSVNVSEVYVGELLNFTVKVSNIGQINAINFNVSDRLPKYFQFVEGNDASYADGIITWNVKRLNVGDEVILWAVVSITNNGTFTNSAYVNSSDMLFVSNSVDVTVKLIIDLSIRKNVSTTHAIIGDEITFTIEVSNNGPSVATNIYVSEELSKQLTLISKDGDYDENEGIWHIAKLASGKKATLTLTVKINSIGDIENKVSVKADQKDSDESNNNFTADVVSVDKKDASVTSQVRDIRYGEDALIIVDLPKDAEGSLNVTVNDIEYNDLPVENGKVILTLPDLTGGDYKVTVSYSGDDNYKANSSEAEFSVAPLKPTIKLEVVDIIEGEIEVLNVTVNAPGSVNITVGGITVEIPLDYAVKTTDVLAASNTDYDGKATWKLLNLAKGTYEVFAVYNGNENYESVNSTASFKVKAEADSNVSVKGTNVGDKTTVEVTYPSDATGNVTVTVDGKKYTKELKDGKATFDLGNLKAGNHTLEVSYSGDDNYVPETVEDSFEVTKVQADISIDTQKVDFGEEKITITLPDDATGTVTLSVDGKKYSAPVENGKTVFDISGLKSGKHSLEASYSGDEKYLAESAEDSFEVTKVKADVTVDDPEIEYGDDEITINLPDDATGTVTVEIDGKKYTAPVENGKAVVSIPNLKVGTHDINIHYSGDDKYSAVDVSETIEVNPVDEPDDENETDKNITHLSQKAHNVALNVHQCGNPILVVLLILLSSAGIQVRRFKK